MCITLVKYLLKNYVHTIFMHELLTYQKSQEWAPRTSEISDIKITSA